MELQTKRDVFYQVQNIILIFGFVQEMCHFAGDSIKLFGEGVIIRRSFTIDWQNYNVAEPTEAKRPEKKRTLFMDNY
jgi:hypothetical protein